ncbi:hypothetical protein VTJ49DRAFT_4897 [Mycothermus thermophilus]|uniref:Glycosyltransferase family 28 N-terminal domain-containing protein n=1 Tax=Humicola insolens TaxID=85995 RepID=A0ABR3V479_HUMIN
MATDPNSDTTPPPTSTESTFLSGSGNPVRAETATHNGRRVTVVRDVQGNVVYPAYIPPPSKAPPLPSGPERRATDLPEKPSPSEPEHLKTGMRRAGTGVSDIDWAGLDTGRKEAAWSSSSSSSSESGSESEPEPLGEGKQNRTRRPKAKRADQAKKKEKKKRTAGAAHDHEDDEDDDNDDDRYRRFRLANEHYRTKGKVSKRDGRLAISLLDTSTKGYLAKALGTAARKVAPGLTEETDEAPPPEGGGGAGGGDKTWTAKHPSPRAPSIATATTIPTPTPPRLNIVIMVIGSRGDVQPFVRLAQLLHSQYNHRVRIATHPAFRDFVASECGPGVDFFSVGGDPSELMAFMVKNPGMIPTLESVRAGDVGRRRRAMADMFRGFWRACINATDDEADPGNVSLMGERDPFVADAIVANPPSFAHVHCAEALGIPLHLMFTFPYTPTQAFPHPLASVKKSNVDPGYTNWISYPLVDVMVWQGLGDLVNEFRTGTLGLDPVSTLWAPGATYRLHVPFTYLISPGLMPKPDDWGDEVEVAGFVFLDQAASYEPPEPLARFLADCPQGEPPVYIGFGSIVVDDPDRFTQMIIEAVARAGVRALVSKGWGGLGGDEDDKIPDDVFLLDSTPHDWLFPRVRACVIHGGAGTTAMALKCGKPTMVVPFFGDQHFWGAMIGRAGAGPEPVPHKHLTAERLAEGIKYCLTEKARAAAERIARDIAREGDGAENACRAFHKGLALNGRRSMRCAMLPERTAVWEMRATGVKLSALAAEMLVAKGLVSWKKLRLLRHCEWNDFEGPGEPLTGAAGSLATSVGGIFSGVGGVPYRVAKSVKRRRRERKKKDGKPDGGSSGTKDNSPSASSTNQEPPQVETSTTHALDRRDSKSSASSAPRSPAEEVMHQVGRGAAKSATALARTPADLILALAQGFHNAPRLYGDETVRRPTRVTGMRSGLRAARRELAYGVYDGWTGVVRHPVRGARETGVRGFVSGVGMGLTGFVLKNLAALVGPVGYTLKGVVKQTERRRRPVKYIRRARMLQGKREQGPLEEQERKKMEEAVVAGWMLMRELWEEMRRAEKRKKEHGGFGEKLDSGARGLRRRREWNVVFESVKDAKAALEALRAGEDLDTVLERGGDGRMDEVRTPDAGGANIKGSPDLFANGSRSGSRHHSGHDEVASSEMEASKTPDGNTEDEQKNPFSTATPAILENKDENRQAMAALHLRPTA